jgi:hypothetical protein
MTARPFAVVAGIATIALVALQVFLPAWSGVHTEPYAVALAICLAVLIGYAVRAGAGKDGARGRWFALGAAGAALIGVTGLASGLLGPETETMIHAPGSSVPLAGLGLTGVFPLADGETIARGDARIAVRTPSGSLIELAPGRPRLVGTAVVEAQPRIAAYVSAFDASGRRLTITQPTGPAFLSPVLQFVQQLGLAGQVLPSDTFATPARHRIVTAVYISAAAARAMHSERIGDRDVVLFSVRDERGRGVPGGIGVAGTGEAARVGDLLVRPILGTYPALVVGSGPHPLALWGGGLCIVAGLALGTWRSRPAGIDPKPLERVPS